MGPNPFIGVIYHWLGGFCSATNFIPFRGIKRWSWEIYWIIQGVAAWLIMPTLMAYFFVPHLFDILSEAHRAPRWFLDAVRARAGQNWAGVDEALSAVVAG